MRERTAELLRSALFESTFVVLGVILALAANEWRETRMHRRQAEAALLAALGASPTTNGDTGRD